MMFADPTPRLMLHDYFYDGRQSSCLHRLVSREDFKQEDKVGTSNRCLFQAAETSQSERGVALDNPTRPEKEALNFSQDLPGEA